MSEGVEDFADKARAWLVANVPAKPWPTDPQDYIAFSRAFQTRLYEAGLAGINWPEQYGGQGLGDAEQRAFADVSAEFAMPVETFSIAMGMCGPTIIALGTEAQKHRLIRPLLRADQIWCQLFSEPEAGSDLAALRTSAVRHADRWTINGQKVWTSHAQYSDFGLLLARSNPAVPKHRGLTMFLIPMDAPGVTVRPLRDMAGGERFNEVFFDDVVLDDEARIGEVDQGWQVAVKTLTFERMSVTNRIRPQSHALSFSSLRERARRAGVNLDAQVRDELVGLHMRERLAELLGDRHAEEARAGTPPGPRGSVGKLVSADLHRFSARAATNVLGAVATRWETDDDGSARLAAAICEAPMMGIAGGTNEIQRNIVGERVLGLPRDEAVDKDVPFRELSSRKPRDLVQ